MQKFLPKVKKLYAKVENKAVLALFRYKARYEKSQLEQARLLYGKNYHQVDDPLISVTIPTYNRAETLAERTIPTILSQTYQHFEVIIVGDHCTDDTAERIRKINDSRIRFINLPIRGLYPHKRERLWKVAGTTPLNRALQEAHGTWLAHLDDDDCYMPYHLETLLRFAQKHDLEMVYSKMNKEFAPAEWEVMGRNLPFAGRREPGSVPHSTVLMRSYLRLFRYDINAWRYNLAGDKHVWIRMGLAGVRAGFLDEITVSSPLRPNTTKAHIEAEDRE